MAHPSIRSFSFARRAARAAACSLVCVAISGLAPAQGLPPLPKAVSPAKGKNAASLPLAEPAFAAEAPLLSPMPKDVAKSAAPCRELDEKAADWMRESMAVMQAQTLRPTGGSKAREAFADVWLAFKTWRDKGYDLDGYGMRVDTVYRALYPAGAFAPDSPFERFKEPRWVCRKAKQQAAAALAANPP